MAAEEGSMEVDGKGSGKNRKAEVAGRNEMDCEACRTKAARTAIGEY